MRIIEHGICIFRGDANAIGIHNVESLSKFKNVYDFTKEPPELVYVKTDEELYVEWEEHEIKQFAQSHIEKYYPLWKQSNIMRTNDEAELTKMGTFIDSVRAWSNGENPDPWDESLTNIIP